MKLTNKLIVGAIMAMGVSMTANAGSAGTTTIGKITQVYTNPEQNSVLIKHTNMINPLACAKSDWYEINATSTLFTQVFSLALAAHQAQNDVAVSIFTTCSPNGYPMVVNILSTK